jgi:choline-sulfatase
MKRQPNILVIMADQLAPFALGAYGHPVVQSPHIDRLAAAGVVFDGAYCNSPLCAPARFSLLSGALPSRIGAYDNAAYLPATVPTIAHYLRARGYDTCLAGKMHFVGPDQLHGFETRLTTDIYPADFGWTPDWDHPEQRIDWWYHNMMSVKQAGVAEITNQLEFDDEVGAEAVRQIYDLARQPQRRPFFLCASFTHPHDPYAARRKYWDLYEHDAIDLPSVAAIPDAQMDPHSRRLWRVAAMDEVEITDDDIRRARRAYYGNVSYFDDWVGRLVGALGAVGLADDTIVVVLADHGDMLGERGLWYKMCFFEWAARVPLIIHGPGRFKPMRVATPVSHVDLLPTLVALADDGGAFEPAAPIDGRSLLPLLLGEGMDGEVAGEYLAEGAIAPVLMIRRGRFKYVHCDADPPQLYDLAADPRELRNLAEEPAGRDTARRFDAEVRQRWNAPDLADRVVRDQRLRRFLYGALTRGRHRSWDHQPRRDAASQYMRNHLDLNVLERNTRFPPPPEPPPD